MSLSGVAGPQKTVDYASLCVDVRLPRTMARASMWSIGRCYDHQCGRGSTGHHGMSLSVVLGPLGMMASP